MSESQTQSSSSAKAQFMKGVDAVREVKRRVCDDNCFVNHLPAFRWPSFISALILMVCAGTQYAFGSFGPELKVHMGYTQTELNLISSLVNAGMFLSVFMGLFYDFFGARWTSLLAALLLFIGWFLCYLSAAGFITGSAVAMGLFMFIQGNGSGAAYTAALTNNVPKFAVIHRGKVTGSMVAMFGASGAVFSQIYLLFFHENIVGFFLFMAIALCLMAIPGVIFFYPEPKMPKPKDDEEEEDGEGSQKNSEETVEIEMEIQTDHKLQADHKLHSKIDELDQYDHFDAHPSYDAPPPDFGQISEASRRAIMELRQFQEQQRSLGTEVTVEKYAEVVTYESLYAKIVRDTNDFSLVYSQRTNLAKMLMTFSFWMVFISFMLVEGAGLTVINNLGSLVVAIEGSPDTGSQKEILVSIVAICSCLGRLVFGFFSDWSAKSCSRSMIQLFGSIAMGVIMLYISLAVKTVSQLYPAVVALGLVYGAAMTLIPSITNDLFGSRFFGSNWSLMRAAPGLSIFVLSAFIASKLYDHYAAGQPLCYGWYCFGWSLIIMCGVCWLGALLMGFHMAFTTWRTRQAIRKKLAEILAESSGEDVSSPERPPQCPEDL